MNTVLAHFERAATRYSDPAASGIWTWFRALETRTFLKKMEKMRPRKILDLGCGTGHYSALIEDRVMGPLTCVDFSPSMLKGLKTRNCKKVLADIQDYHPEEFYDLILCMGVLEFIPNPQKVLENISGMLRPGGSFVALLPCRSFWTLFYRLYHQGHAIRINTHLEKTFPLLAMKAGLKINEKIRASPIATLLVLQNI